MRISDRAEEQERDQRSHGRTEEGGCVCCTSDLSLSGVCFICACYFPLSYLSSAVEPFDQRDVRRSVGCGAVETFEAHELSFPSSLPSRSLALNHPSRIGSSRAGVLLAFLDGLVLVLLRGFVLLPVAGSVDHHPPVRRRGVVPRPTVCRLRQRTSPPLPSLASLRTLCSLLLADGLLAAFAAFQETNPFLTLVPTPLTATHVVLDPTLPLINLPLRDHLDSLGRGIEIVTLEWVKQSMRADRTADVDEYRLAPTGGPGARELARQVNGKGKERERTR